jgi:hypothetical protein
MKPFKFLTKNIRTSEYLNGEIMDVGPVFYHPTTLEPIRGITYRDEDGERKYCIIGTGHPLWDEIPTNR